MSLIVHRPWKQQPQYAVGVSPEYASNLAFLWHAGPGDPTRNFAPDATQAAVTLTGGFSPTSVGRGYSSSTGTAIKWANGWLKTSNPSNGEGDFTFSVLANPANTATRMALFSQDMSTGTASQVYLIANCNTGYSVSAGTLFLGIYNSVDGGSYLQATSVIDGKWHVFTARRQGSNLEIYVDDLLVASTTSTPKTIYESGIGTAIGGLHQSSAYNGTQSTALVAAWDRALPVSQVKELGRNPWQLFAPLPSRFLIEMGASSGNTIAVPAGSIALTGYVPTVVTTANQIVSVPSGGLVLTGQTPTIVSTDNKTISVPAGSLVFTGNAPAVVASGNMSISVPVGSIVLVGYAPVVATSSGGSVTIKAGSWIRYRVIS
jgi:hypothetical protein